MAAKTVFITSGTTYTIPADFVAFISVEVIGGGSGGVSSNIVGGGGGAGGGYSKSTAVTGIVASGTAYVSIGSGSAGGATPSAGGQTWFNAASNAAPTLTSQGALANGGGAPSGATSGTGGSVTGAIGTTTFAGGAGG